ncbi:MAG: cytochrome P450 [Rhodospirillales bacterium]|jgi:cytochrome P450
MSNNDPNDSSPREGCPVHDWATDYDVMDPDYNSDPGPIWKDLRERCPIAHSTRWGGSWMPTRYEDVRDMARAVPTLSSRAPGVIPPSPEMREILIQEVKEFGAELPPISADPPLHKPFKQLILPLFSPKAVETYRPFTEKLANNLIDQIIDNGTVADGAVDYAQQLPPRVIAYIIGIDETRADEFTEWVRGILEQGQANPEIRLKYRRIIRDYFQEMIAERRRNPRDDAISKLMEAKIEGESLSDYTIIGVCFLLLVAGIDTTWSSIGSALFHFGTKTDHRNRMYAEPELFPTAIEELLRFYSPVKMARRVLEPVAFGGVEMQPGDKVIMNFPAANRDPEVFENPDEVMLDREQNRHIAFGVGIHRCAGSNLARMEMDVALRTWFNRIKDFEVIQPEKVIWSGGQVRGPRVMPMRIAGA